MRGGPGAARQWLRSFWFALALAVVLRGVVGQVFRIRSGSMLPTLQAGDYVFVSPLAYGVALPGSGWLFRYRDPEPGDVIVFTHPADRTQDFVKRVVAVAGEQVEIRDKAVLVAGIPRDLLGPYFADGRAAVAPGPRDQFGPVEVPAGRLFVLGDSRDRSYDSRFWGFAAVDDVKGEALVVSWSWDERDRRVRWERLATSVQ